MSKREEYQTRIEEQLALWEARFEALKAKAGKEMLPEVKKQLDLWHAAGESALAKLSELKAATGDAWDQVKEQMEKAWHAIEIVLNEREPRPAARTFTKEEIQSLTPEQEDAVLEALVIAVVANAKVRQDEVASFNDELKNIPWVQPGATIVEKAQAAQARAVAAKTDAERLALLETIAARVPRGPVAEKTLAMMAIVVAGDNAAKAAEAHNLTAFATAFGISNERLEVIAASMRGA